jgi:hypothetical protein
MSSHRTTCLLVATTLAAAGALASQDGRTLLVSVDEQGGLAELGSGSPRGSADGRFVVFSSQAASLVPGDTNQADDVFVRDMWSGLTKRVSVSSAGDEANGPSTAECISFDGRFIGFSSEASNLVSADTNGTMDVFVYDQVLGTTERVSLASGGGQASDRSLGCSISGDGRFVVFSSDADDLVPGDSNASRDVFLHDRTTGTTTRVSLDSQGTQSNGSSYVPSISRNGRCVTFSSYGTNLVPGDTNGCSDVFVRDLATERTTRVSIASTGAQGNLASWLSSISAGGDVVAFQSTATNLVQPDTNGCADIFVHDSSTGRTSRVSVDSEGNESRGGDELITCLPSLSGNGRWVAFHSYQDRLVKGDTNSECDVFVHDVATGDTSRADISTSGKQGNRPSINATISDDGRFVAFQSDASTLLDASGPQAERVDGGGDVFLRERYAVLGLPYCFGDGSGTECPCGNSGKSDEGCRNSVAQGGYLTALGTSSIGANDLVLVAARLPVHQTATLLAGEYANQAGLPFHDGLLCIDAGAARIGTRQTGADGLAIWGPGLGTSAGWTAGMVRYFQVWYADPHGPCGTGQNQTNAFQLAFVP